MKEGTKCMSEFYPESVWASEVISRIQVNNILVLILSHFAIQVWITLPSASFVIMSSLWKLCTYLCSYIDQPAYVTAGTNTLASKHKFKILLPRIHKKHHEIRQGNLKFISQRGRTPWGLYFQISWTLSYMSLKIINMNKGAGNR